MRVTCTFTTPLNDQQISRVKEGLLDIDSRVVEDSRTASTVTFSCPSEDVNPFGKLFESWLDSSDSPFTAYQMTSDT